MTHEFQIKNRKAFCLENQEVRAVRLLFSILDSLKYTRFAQKIFFAHRKFKSKKFFIAQKKRKNQNSSSSKSRSLLTVAGAILEFNALKSS